MDPDGGIDPGIFPHFNIARSFSNLVSQEMMHGSWWNAYLGGCEYNLLQIVIKNPDLVH